MESDLYYLDDDFSLNIGVNNTVLKITKELIKKLDDNLIKSVESNIYKNLVKKYNIFNFFYFGNKVEIFEIPKICYLSKENIKVPIYSIIHLKLILSKIKYQKPYFINKRK